MVTVSTSNISGNRKLHKMNVGNCSLQDSELLLKFMQDRKSNRVPAESEINEYIMNNRINKFLYWIKLW